MQNKPNQHLHTPLPRIRFQSLTSNDWFLTINATFHLKLKSTPEFQQMHCLAEQLHLSLTMIARLLNTLAHKPIERHKC